MVLLNKKQKIIIILSLFFIAIWLLVTYGTPFLNTDFALYQQINDFHKELTRLNGINNANASNAQPLDYLLWGILFGIIFISIIYNLLCFIKIKNKKYIAFSIFFFLILIGQITCSDLIGFIHEDINHFFSSHNIIIINLILLSGIFFIYSHLELKSKNPTHKKMFQFLLVFSSINIILWFSGIRFIIVLLSYILILLSCFFTILTGISYIKSQHTFKGLFSLLVLMIGLGIDILNVLGDINYRLPVSAFFISAAIASSLLTIILTDQLFVLHERNQELRVIEESLTELSLTDELSQLYNKRFFNEKLKYETNKAHRTGKSLSLLLLDIDHFKRYNDSYGHNEGDKAITKMGRIIKENIRNTDYACRFGGEEFAVILTETSKYSAEKYVAQRLHEQLSKQVFLVTKNHKVFLTVSIGISQLQKGERAETLIEQADEALYKAKRLGRNRTVLYTKQSS